MHLVPLAPAEPAATFLDTVEGQVEALPHPIPVSSRLYHARLERQTALLLCSFAIRFAKRLAIVPARGPAALQEVSHGPSKNLHDVIESVF